MICITFIANTILFFSFLSNIIEYEWHMPKISTTSVTVQLSQVEQSCENRQYCNILTQVFQAVDDCWTGWFDLTDGWWNDSRTLEMKDLGLIGEEGTARNFTGNRPWWLGKKRYPPTLFLLLVYMNPEVAGALPAQTLLVPNFRLTPLSLRADDSENLALNCSSSD